MATGRERGLKGSGSPTAVLLTPGGDYIAGYTLRYSELELKTEKEKEWKDIKNTKQRKNTEREGMVPPLLGANRAIELCTL